MRTYRVADCAPERDPEWRALPSEAYTDLDRCPSVVLTWDELAAVNDQETMSEIDGIAVGERTILGQCDPIERVS